MKKIGRFALALTLMGLRDRTGSCLVLFGPCRHSDRLGIQEIIEVPDLRDLLFYLSLVFNSNTRKIAAQLAKSSCFSRLLIRPLENVVPTKLVYCR